MKWFIGYNDNGEILGNVTASSLDIANYMFAQAMEVEVPIQEELCFVSFLEGEPVVMEKGTLEVPYQVIGLSVFFNSLPVGTQVEVGNLTLTTDEESTQIDFDEPGTYAFDITPPPEFKSVKMEIQVG